MADKVVAMQASDLFSLGTYFNAQNSSSPHQRDPANILDADGNNECETMVNNRTEYSASYAYCNATPDIGGDLSTHATTFGAVFDSKSVTGLTINFAAGQYATVDVSGHNHDNNAHASSVGDADVSGAIPANAGFGVPDFGVTLGDNATPISATLAFSCNHVDANDANGEHWVGKNTTFRADLTMSFEGLPTTQSAAALEGVMTGWTIDTNGPGDSNQEFDTFSLTAHQFFDAN